MHACVCTDAVLATRMYEYLRGKGVSTCVRIGYILAESMWEDCGHVYPTRYVEGGVYLVCMSEGLYVQ